MKIQLRPDVKLIGGHLYQHLPRTPLEVIAKYGTYVFVLDSKGVTVNVSRTAMRKFFNIVEGSDADVSGRSKATASTS